jgi:hypothetical protein
MTAVGAVVLRIGEVDSVGLPRDKVTQVMQETVDAPQAVGPSTATRARAPCVVSATSDDLGLWQGLDTSDSLSYVSKVFAGARHGDVLQVRLFSPGYIGKFPSSTPHKTLYCCYSLELLNLGLRKASREGHESTGESLLRLAAIGGKGPADLSTRIDDYLYGENS